VTKAAGYIRVSTGGQAEHGLGLDIQRDAIAAYCKREGLDLVGIYEDAAVSGSNGEADREGWPLLVEGLKAGEFSVVVVMRLDRLARDLMLQETLLLGVQRLGGELVSIDEPDLCNGDPTRTMFRQIKGAVSEYDKAMIVARLKAGRRKKARQGGYSGGWVPYGYIIEGQGTDARPVVDEAAAAVVRGIFETYGSARSKASLHYIADWLNGTGVPTARGGRWAAQTVRVILTNPFYLGRDGHEAIITEKVFQACAKRMARRSKPPQEVGA
jgi:DNA invertase Pin-like site-specific DNA recombinase